MKSLEKSKAPIQKANAWLKTCTGNLELNSERTNALTIPDALTSPQISVLLKTDKKAALNITMGYVRSALVSCGIDNENLGREIVKMFLNRNKLLKIDEVAMILRDGIYGKYGKIYGQISIPVICEWIENHNEQVAIHLEDQHQNRKHNLTEPCERSMSTDTAWKAITPFLKKK